MTLTDVSMPIAFGAGFLSFFSPCILPMIPVYIMYMTGSTMESQINERKLLALRRTLGFVIGFTIIFMIMGTSASFLGRIFIRNRDIFYKLSGILIILFGLNMMGILRLKFLNVERRTKLPKKTTSWFTSILMGMAFAAGWTPCFGPVLASILMYASASNTVSQGAMLLLIYSIGMAIPFILTALFINRFVKFMERAEKLMIYLPKIGGLIMVIFGLLIYFNKVINISRLLL
ncbi:MAG: cytochrome c biogenesis protein CcdA [Tissierellia bacterium]|nr:cytochrome c biogenesis protein CcdA [Tissierellia bacterium]